MLFMKGEMKDEKLIKGDCEIKPNKDEQIK